MKNEKLKTMWNKFKMIMWNKLKMIIEERGEVIVGGHLMELTTTLTIYSFGVFISDEYNPLHWWTTGKILFILALLFCSIEFTVEYNEEDEQE